MKTKLFFANRMVFQNVEGPKGYEGERVKVNEIESKEDIEYGLRRIYEMLGLQVQNVADQLKDDHADLEISFSPIAKTMEELDAAGNTIAIEFKEGGKLIAEIKYDLVKRTYQASEIRPDGKVQSMTWQGKRAEFIMFRDAMTAVEGGKMMQLNRARASIKAYAEDTGLTFTSNEEENVTPRVRFYLSYGRDEYQIIFDLDKGGMQLWKKGEKPFSGNFDQISIVLEDLPMVKAAREAKREKELREITAGMKKELSQVVRDEPSIVRMNTRQIDGVPVSEFYDASGKVVSHVFYDESEKKYVFAEGKYNPTEGSQASERIRDNDIAYIRNQYLNGQSM